MTILYKERAGDKNGRFLEDFRKVWNGFLIGCYVGGKVCVSVLWAFVALFIAHNVSGMPISGLSYILVVVAIGQWAFSYKEYRALHNSKEVDR